jgi:hypothetical protein
VKAGYCVGHRQAVARRAATDVSFGSLAEVAAALPNNAPESGHQEHHSRRFHSADASVPTGPTNAQIDIKINARTPMVDPISAAHKQYR